MTHNRSIEYFFLNFFSDFYIYESKRTLIVGEKDYNIYRDVIEFFLDYAIGDNLSKVKEESKNLEKLFYMNYTKNLLLFFKNKIDNVEFENLKTKAVDEKYLEVIGIIEEKFNFSFGTDFELRNDALPDENCKNSVKDMAEVFTDFLLAKEILQKYIITEDIYDVNTNSEEYFILKVIYSEFWNFLSHMAFALKYDEGIDNYESNITRATRHLERAILDIYKFILVEKKLIDSSVLSARNLELKSFGNQKQLSKGYTTYRDLITEKLK